MTFRFNALHQEFPKHSPEKPKEPDYMSPDFYARLGLPPKATQAEIKSAFKILSKKLRSTPEDEAKNTVILQNLGEAWDGLKTPEKQAAYDETRPAVPAIDKVVINDLLKAASRGRSVFATRVQDWIGKDMLSQEELVNIPEIKALVYKDIVQGARISDRMFNERVHSWIKTGALAKEAVATEEIKGCAYADLTRAAEKGSKIFHDHMQNWVKAFAITEQEAVTHPKVLEIVRNDLKRTAALGEFNYKDHLYNWEKVGIRAA